jgi:hypothetical protein
MLTDFFKVIVATVKSFYTLNTHSLKSIRTVQRFAMVYFTVFSFLPIPIVLLARFIPGGNKTRFGKLGTMTHKVIIVVIAAALLSKSQLNESVQCTLTPVALENSFRAGINFLPPRPVTNPAWYHKRAAFYVFLPTIEVLVVALYAITRVDQRLHEEAVQLQEKEDNVERGAA